MTNCRIGKVTYKSAPHLSEIIPHVRGAEFREIMHEHTNIICDGYPKGLAGFAIVAWGFDGTFMRGTRMHDDSFVGKTLLPSFVADILRRDVAIDVSMDVMDGII